MNPKNHLTPFGSGRIVSLAIDSIRRKGKVATGPFVGVPAIEEALDYSWNMLLGIYEFYLHEAVSEIIATKPPLIVDVGAASGYYTVGFAHVLPKSKHIAFEMNDETRKSLNLAIKKIKTEVSVEGMCTPSRLKEILKENPRGFLLMDCEGAERELLEENVIENARYWTILLEVHDYHAPGAGEEIQKRFRHTHNIKEIWSREPTCRQFEFLLKWPLNLYCEKTLQRMCYEARGGPMRFFYMVPKSVK